MSELLVANTIITSVFFVPLKFFVSKIDTKHQDWVENTIRETLARSAALRFHTTSQKSLWAIRLADPCMRLYQMIHNELVRCEVTFRKRTQRLVTMTIVIYWLDGCKTRFEQEQIWEALSETVRVYLTCSSLPYTYEWYLPARIS